MNLKTVSSHLRLAYLAIIELRHGITLRRSFKADTVSLLWFSPLFSAIFLRLRHTLKSSQLMHLQSVPAFEKSVHCMVSVHTLFFQSDPLELEYIKHQQRGKRTGSLDPTARPRCHICHDERVTRLLLKCLRHSKVGLCRLLDREEHTHTDNLSAVCDFSCTSVTVDQ